MSDPKPMPRTAIIAAGWLILVAAAVGFGAGMARDLKTRGGVDPDTGEVVAPIKGVTNATALTAPPITEADVRRWTREELAAAHPAAPKKPKADADTPDAADDVPTTPPPLTIVTPSNGNVVAPKPQTPAQIPF